MQFFEKSELEKKMKEKSNPYVVALTGLPGVGKDTVAQLLADNFWFQTFRFASPLDACMESLVGLAAFGSKDSSKPLDVTGKSLRESFNALGGAIRETFGQDVFAKSLVKKMQAMHSHGNTLEVMSFRYVVTDLRKPWEFEALAENFPRMIVLDIIRESDLNERWKSMTAGAQSYALSDQTALLDKIDSYKGDFSFSAVHNNGSLSDLFENVKAVLDNHTSL